MTNSTMPCQLLTTARLGCGPFTTIAPTNGIAVRLFSSWLLTPGSDSIDTLRRAHPRSRVGVAVFNIYLYVKVILNGSYTRTRVDPAEMPSKAPSRVVVHPIVLLSVVDHFNRLRKIGNQKRVVGVLLGAWRANGVVDIATSYAGEFLH